MLIRLKRSSSSWFGVLLLLLLTAPAAWAQPLSGTKTVGIVNSTGNDYAGIGNAIADVVSKGVNGPLTLLLTSDQTTVPSASNGNNGGNYGFNEPYPITIPAIPGASATNTVTIRPAPGVLATITSATVTRTEPALFILRGVDYFIFDGSNVPNGTNKNLFINNLSTVVGACVFRVTSASSTDGATHNELRNLIVQSNSNNAAFDQTCIQVTGDGNNNNSFVNNIVQKTANAISITGNTTVPSTGIVVADNVVGVTRTPSSGLVTAMGIQAVNTPGIQITRNTMYNLDQTSTFNVRAISLSGSCDGAIVNRNKIRSVNNDAPPSGSTGYGATGILLDTGPSTGVRVVNNAISDITAVGGPGIGARAAGITVLSGTGIAIYNNSVQVDGDRLSQSPAAALVIAIGVTALDVRNNIFSNIRTTGNPPTPSTDYAVYVQDGAANPFATIDYNMYDVRTAPPEYIGRLNGVDAPTLAAWRAVTGQDRSSMSTSGYQPVTSNQFPIEYTSRQDLMPVASTANNYALNSTGIQLPGVTADIDGNPRPTTTTAGAPDLGAYEFTPTAARPALEAGPVAANVQTFYFFGRPIVDLTYPAVNPPTGVTVTYYPGETPPAPRPSTALYQRAYYTIAATTPGDGYLSQTIHYEPALLNTISLETEQRIAQQTAGGYRTDPATVVDVATRTLTASTAPGALLVPFGLFTIVDNLAPLPVELSEFVATRRGTAAQLSWATASEKNNRGFEVQVSTDGRNFQTLAFVEGAGTCSSPKRYRYFDSQPGKAALRYYRLRQLDTDGSSSFSPVRTLRFEETTALTDDFEVGPNPLREGEHPVLFVTARRPLPGTKLTVTDAMGQQVLTRTLNLEAGSSAQQLPGLEQLPAGLYTVRLLSNGQINYQKLLKE